MQVNNLYKAYGNHVVFEDFSMEIPKGEWTYIKGPSGCGKTTLLRILMGLEKADSGNIMWDASEQTQNPQTRQNTSLTESAGTVFTGGKRPKITAVFQEDRLCMNESAIKNVAMVLHKHSCALQSESSCMKVEPDAISELIVSHFSRVGLADREALNQPVRKLSGGMRRRVAIVRAVMAPGDVLLLDEPFQGLDNETKNQVVQYIHKEQRGRTVLLVTHDEDGIDISYSGTVHA